MIYFRKRSHLIIALLCGIYSVEIWRGRLAEGARIPSLLLANHLILYVK